MLIAGGLLILVAVGALVYAHFARRAARRLTATETLTCGDVDALAKGVAGEVGAGSFSQRCEVVGTAEPGPAGVIKAPESGADAVWHRTTVTRHFRERQRVQRDGKTVDEWVSRSETVSDLTSEAPFAVRDDSGTVLVAPAGADVDAPERVVDRSERQADASSAAGAVLDALLDTDDRRDQRLEHEEWIIRPGARLYVHGEVSDHSGQLTFAEGEGRFLISTRSEQDIVRGKETGARWAMIGGLAAAVLGVALLVAGAAA